MNKELKSLTWKYFWQQKFKEIMVIPIILVFGFILAKFTRWFDVWFANIFNDVLICEELSGGCWIIYAVLGVFLLLAICLILFIVGYLIYLFISYNWDKANERAKADIRKKKAVKR